MPTPREEMRIVARRLEPLNVPFAFVGGAVEDVNFAKPSVREFISRGFGELLNHPDLPDALLGHQPETLRIPLDKERFAAIAALVPRGGFP